MNTAKQPAAAFAPAPSATTPSGVRRPIAPTPRRPDRDKTYFGAINAGAPPSAKKRDAAVVGRSKNGEYIDAFKIVMCGVDPESAAVASQGEAAARLVADLTMPTSREVAAFLDDPESFLAAWPVEDQRLHMLNLVLGVLTFGQNIEPVCGERCGDYYVVRNGRHRVAVQRFCMAVLDGSAKCPDVLRAAFDEARSRGDGWHPMLTALPPPDDVRTGQPIDAGTFAELTQAVRVMTVAELYERAMRRVSAVREAGAKPDFDAMARNYPGTTGNTIAEWERLSKMHPGVRDLVLLPGADGRRFPLQSALTFAALPEDQQLAAVQAMIAAGDTRTATARATAQALRAAETADAPEATDAARESDDAPEADAPEADAPEADDAARESDEAPEAPKAPKAPKATPATTRKPAVIRPAWGVKELKKFLTAAASAEKPAPMVKALLSLLSAGPDRMDAMQIHAIPGLREYLSSQDK